MRAKRVGQWLLLNRTKRSAQKNSLLRDVRSLQTKTRSSERAFAKTGLAVIRPAAFDGGPKRVLAALRAPRALGLKPSGNQALRLKPSGAFPKTAHWTVFLTRFHLIDSNSCQRGWGVLLLTKVNKMQRAMPWRVQFVPKARRSVSRNT